MSEAKLSPDIIYTWAYFPTMLFVDLFFNRSIKSLTIMYFTNVFKKKHTKLKSTTNESENNEKNYVTYFVLKGQP